MVLDRGQGDEKGLPDFLVRFSLTDQQDDLLLAAADSVLASERLKPLSLG